MGGKEAGEILGPMFEKLAQDGRLALCELGLRKEANVLDVGTGSGNFAIFLALEGFDVLTGEPAADETRYARQPWEERAGQVGVRNKIRFQSFDACDMPFEEGAFDAVFFFGVLHHVEEGARAGILRDALRVTKGAVAFFEPRRELLEELWVNDPDHPQAADPSRYVGDLEISEQRLEGTIMDIFIYRKAG